MKGRILMVQGTMSHVGKSVLVAALCRILRQDGLRVAPFKAQNMALNSFVTPDGCEIGRAQAVQAEAAGVEPQAEMNPILLKPEADHRSQVVVMGRPVGSFTAKEYHEMKPRLLPVVLDALERLRSTFDVVVVEGAGSPVEVNLRAHDLANMGLAVRVGAPVLLVGDIDRGGVFAQLIGTLELLEPQERFLVKGLIINKFRGDKSLLSPGLQFLEQRAGIPVAGVIPYWEELALPAEDSVALEGVAQKRRHGVLDVAVVRLPHISNFDDVDPLGGEPGVGIRFVRAGEELAQPDLILVPGSKTTMADLAFLRTSGLAQAIIMAAAQGSAVVGICGGFQMLGLEIVDPDHVESEQPYATGLGLLPVVTIFQRNKITNQVEGEVVCDYGLLAGCRGLPFKGYEIHIGSSARLGVEAPFVLLRRSGEGCQVAEGALGGNGWILGTYVHGIFANDDLRRRILSNLALRKGVTLPKVKALRQDPHDRWAAVVRAHLDMGLIYRLLDDRV